MTIFTTPPKKIRSEENLEDYITNNFDAVVNQTGLNLLLVERQPALLGSQLDMLALDESARPWVIELKLSIATTQIIGQALRYSNTVNDISLQDLGELLGNAGTGDLQERFNEKFGRDLTQIAGGAPGVLLIAKGFDTETMQSIAALKAYEAPVVALCYTVNQLGIELTTAEESSPVQIDTLVSGSPLPAQLHAAIGKVEEEKAGEGRYRVFIHDDVRKFWARFTRTYSNPVAPFSLINERYRVWEAQTSSRILKKEPLNRGILARQIKALATRDGEWARVFYRQDCDTKMAIDPTQILEAGSRHGMPFTKVAYVRNEHMDQGVNLIK